MRLFQVPKFLVGDDDNYLSYICNGDKEDISYY